MIALVGAPIALLLLATLAVRWALLDTGPAAPVNASSSAPPVVSALPSASSAGPSAPSQTLPGPVQRASPHARRARWMLALSSASPKLTAEPRGAP